MSSSSRARRALSQNFLINQQVIASLVSRVAKTTGSIIEIGPGNGALTSPLAALGRPVTAVEIDARLARGLRSTAPDTVEIVADDFLSFELSTSPHVVVGNIPFHITTAILRKLLSAPGWTEAILLMQWDVAKRRAGVGAGTLLSAQWAPWFTFELGERVPRTAFRPAPTVDGGILRFAGWRTRACTFQNVRRFKPWSSRCFPAVAGASLKSW